MAEFILDPAAIDELINSEEGPVARHLAGVAAEVTSMAKVLCPVDTGRLRASIAWQFARDDEGLFARCGTNVEYAVYVHAHNPFLTDALENYIG